MARSGKRRASATRRHQVESLISPNCKTTVLRWVQSAAIRRTTSRGSTTFRLRRYFYAEILLEAAMGVGEWFSEFCGELQIDTEEKISRRYKAITKRLNLDFWNTDSELSHSLYVGSYGRNTAIRSISDLDIVMELPWSVYDQYNDYLVNGQSALLQEVRNSIASTYSSTSVSADGQVVLVPFADGTTFEVVPGFRQTDGSYVYPDATGGGAWQTTDPRAEIDAIKTRNILCNSNLVRLCRMMRAWKFKWDVPIGGLLIDTLAYQFIEAYPYRDKSFLYYDFMSRDFFEWMAGQSETQEWWRAPGSGAYVYRKGLFQYKAKRCFNIAVDAIAYANVSREWSARDCWREIFGTAFPN